MGVYPSDTNNWIQQETKADDVKGRIASLKWEGSGYIARKRKIVELSQTYNKPPK